MKNNKILVLEGGFSDEKMDKTNHLGLLRRLEDLDAQPAAVAEHGVLLKNLVVVVEGLHLVVLQQGHAARGHEVLHAGVGRLPGGPHLAGAVCIS